MMQSCGLHLGAEFLVKAAFREMGDLLAPPGGQKEICPFPLGASRTPETLGEVLP